MDYINNFLDLSLEAAPWLVLGLFLGGLMKALIPAKFLEKHLKGSGFGSVMKAAILGAPLPLCSCGVIPAALGLRQAGASKPATVSFLVSTPETGVDSVTVTYALMGPFMAIVRPISALASAMTAGLLVSIFVKESEPSSKGANKVKRSACCETEKPTTSSPVSCCSGSNHNEEKYLQSASNDSCCGEKNASGKEKFVQKASDGVKYAFTDLLDGIILWLLVGLFFAAAVKTFLPTDFLTQWGQGFPALLIMVLAGIPMYICATASTPIAAGLMLAGVSPGAALVLLLTGPATNISTLGIIGKELGKKTMFYYLLGTVTVALLAGLLVDWLVQYYDINIVAQLHDNHNSLPIGLQWGALLLLFVLPLRKLINYHKLYK